MKSIKWLYFLVILALLAAMIPVGATAAAQEIQGPEPAKQEKEDKGPEVAQPGVTGPQLPEVAQPKGVRTPEEAIRIIDPDLRSKARAGGSELVKIAVLVTPGTDLSRYFERLVVRQGKEFDRITGLAPASTLIKLATVPATLAILNMETRQAPQPPNPVALAGEGEAPQKLTKSLEGAVPQALPRAERAYNPRQETKSEKDIESFFTEDTNGVRATWGLGITGDGQGYDPAGYDPLKMAVVDTGVDFANPDLFGIQARVTSPASPYFDPSTEIGWPIAFDDRSMSDYALDIQDYRGNWGWYMNAGVEIQDPDLGSLDPFTFTVTNPDTGIDVVYTISSTVQFYNLNGGHYRFGWHPDDTLADALGESAGVLLSGEQSIGLWGTYDTIYVDMLATYVFDAGPANGWATLGQEIACINLGWSGPTSCDLSGGMIYFIADGSTPVPASDWLYGLGAPADGSVVAFMINDVTENGGDHGTLCAGTAVGQGNITMMPYAGSYGSTYWPPTWYNPATYGGISQGPGKDTRLVAMGNYYAGGSSFNYYDFTALGYDGIPAGAPGDNYDQPHIYSNSYGSGSVENDGWDLSSRYVTLINRGYVAQEGIDLPDGGDHSALFVGSTGNSGFGYGTVTSPQPETAVMVGVSTVFGQFNLGDTALFPDWVNWGHLGGFSDRGPTSMSTLGVATLSNGFFGSGDLALNELTGGDWAVDYWAGTSRSGPETGGILALIYDAYYQKFGTYPSWSEARNLLMNGARTIYSDPKAQGAGMSNALNAAEIVTGTRGVQVSNEDGDGFWIPGSYRGNQFPGFARGLFSGESDTETFTVTNNGLAPVVADVAPVTMELYETREWNFTTFPLAQEGPGTRYYGRRLYGPPGSPGGSGGVDPFFDSTNPADTALLADADVMVVRLSWPESQFQENIGANWWFVYAYAWRDQNSDSTWYTDANSNTVYNSGEGQPEIVRINYDYHGNTAEIRIREPMNLIDGEVGPNEPPLAPMSDIVIMPRHFYYGGFDTTDLKVTVELYHEVPWNELELSTDEVVVPPEGQGTFVATANTILSGATLFSENFDGVTAPAIPGGWEVVDTMGTAGDWATNAGTVHPSGGGVVSAPNVAYFNSYSANSSNNTRLQQTAGIDLSAVPGAMLSFWMYHDTGYSGNADRVQPQVSTDGGASWVNVGSAVTRYQGPGIVGWQQHTVDLSAYAGLSDVRIGFLGISAYGNDCHIDDVAVLEAIIEPPGEYAGYIKVSYELPYEYAEYIPVEKQIWFPTAIDPVLGGVDQPTLYDNGVMFGATGPSAAGQRAESGDWRFFYTDVADQPDPGTYLLAHTTWQSSGTPPWATDIDTLFYGPVPNDPLFVGHEDIFGPHGLAVVGGSLRAGSGPDWEYYTSTGGPEDWTSIPLEQAGLYGVAAQVVRWGGEQTRVPYSISVGTVQATPEVYMNGLTCLSCTVPIYFKTNAEDLAGLPLDAVGYGFNQPVHETLPVTQSESTYYYYTITANDAYKLQINTSNPDPSVDVDLNVYYNGDLVGSSGRSDANEQVILTFPAAGEYEIELYGYGIPMGVSPTALDIVEISGAGAMTVEGLPDSIEPGTLYEMALHFETRPEYGSWDGSLFLGPAGSPLAIEIPVRLDQGAATKTAWQDTVFPGDLITYTIVLTASPGPLMSWELTDPIPAGMEFVAVDGADYYTSPDRIEWAGYPGFDALLNEGFEGAFPPTGWNKYQTGDAADPGWQQGTSGSTGSHGDPHTGAYYAWHNDDNLTTSAVSWLVTPQIAVPAGGAMLAFWQRDYYDTYYQYHGVWITTDADPDPTTSTYVELWTGDTSADWVLQTIDLDAYAGQNVYLAFRYEGDFMDEWYIDDVQILQPAASPAHTITLTLRGMDVGFQTNTALVTTGPNTCPISATVLVAGALPTWEKEIWIDGQMYGPLDSPFTVVPGDEVTVVDRVSVTGQEPITYTLLEEWTDSLSLVNYEADAGTLTPDSNSLTWDVAGGAMDTWYTLTKTFTVNGDAGWTDLLTETLTVENGPAPTVIPLEFDIPARLAKSGPDVAEPGELITYTIVVETPGPLAGTPVLTDVLPAGVAFADALTATFGTPTYDAGDNAVYWTAVGTPLPRPSGLPSGFTGVSQVEGLTATAQKAAAAPAPQSPKAVLWDQPGNGANGIVSNYYSNESQGTYSSDDFVITDLSWDVDTIFVDGFINLGSLSANATALAWYIYADSNGEPAGHPGDGNEVWSYVTTPADPAVSYAGSSPTLDVVAATGGSLHLPAGTYWLVFFPSINVTDPSEQDRFNWFKATTTNANWCKLYDDGHFGGLPWTDIATLLGDTTWHDTAFRLEGTAINTPSLVTITFQATVTADPGDVVTNTADLDYNGTMLSADTAFRVPAPSLYITKTVEPEFQYAGMPVTYTIVFGNAGDGEAVGGVVSDVLPAEIEYVSSTPMGTYDATAHELVWEDLDLMPGDVVTATVVGTINAEALANTVLTNTAYIFYEGVQQGMAEVQHYVLGTACEPVTGVALTVLTPEPIFIGDVVTIQVDVSPATATAPYSYTVAVGAPAQSASTNPFTVHLIFGQSGTQTVTIDVWNCDMTEPVPGTVDLLVRTRVYLPIITRNDAP